MPPSVTFKDGFPDTYSDDELDLLFVEASGMFIWAAVKMKRIEPVIASGETLDLVRGEIQRRALREAQESARTATVIAIAAVMIGIVVGLAQIAVSVVIAYGWIGDGEPTQPRAPRHH